MLVMGPPPWKRRRCDDEAFQQDPPELIDFSASRSFVRCITYNIRDGGCNNLNMALRSMQQMRVDLGFLTETKLDHEMYTKRCCGYKVLSTKAASRHQGGVALFWRHKSSRWSIEGVRTFGPNVIRGSLVSGNHRWTLVGAYIPPSRIQM